VEQENVESLNESLLILLFFFYSSIFI